MPETWHLKWSYSSSGSTYFITERPRPGANVWDSSDGGELNALAFDNEQVARGYALALASFFDVNLVPVRRWNGLPAATNWVNQ